mmetsp:Transcript_3310/g.2762  ORF Transcript_3310/g.2762 Transcript_3310/m.2762 type:complete len:173 (+) Transcript_3310:376-894(+)
MGKSRAKSMINRNKEQSANLAEQLQLNNIDQSIFSDNSLTHTQISKRIRPKSTKLDPHLYQRQKTNYNIVKDIRDYQPSIPLRRKKKPKPKSAVFKVVQDISPHGYGGSIISRRKLVIDDFKPVSIERVPKIFSYTEPKRLSQSIIEKTRSKKSTIKKTLFSPLMHKDFINF